MTDKIIAAAREAGMTTGENQKHNGEYWWRSLGRQTNVSTSDLERLYAIAYRQGLEDAAKRRAPSPRELSPVGTGALLGEQQYCFNKGWKEGAASVRAAIRALKDKDHA